MFKFEYSCFYYSEAVVLPITQELFVTRMTCTVPTVCGTDCITVSFAVTLQNEQKYLTQNYNKNNFSLYKAYWLLHVV
jgi:hypothetical protein